MRVALVDTSSVVLKGVSGFLADAGCVVVPFKDSDAAFEAIAADRAIETLLTSFEFPGTSGLQLCAKARELAKAENRSLYILMMSSDTGRHKLLDALENGADGFISKPPNPQELEARLNAAKRLKSDHRYLVHLATVDQLSETYNRQAFLELGEKICNKASAKEPIAVIMLDIDHFKQINDTYGHSTGDRVIKCVGNLIKQLPGIAGRLGGEEFGIVFSADKRQVMQLAEELRIKIMRDSTVSDSGEMLSVTVSVGVALSCRTETIIAMLKRADSALYRAKFTGRNCVKLF